MRIKTLILRHSSFLSSLFARCVSLAPDPLLLSSWFALHPLSKRRKKALPLPQKQAVGRRNEETNKRKHRQPQKKKLLSDVCLTVGYKTYPMKKCFPAYLNSAVLLDSVCQLSKVPRVPLTKGKGNFSPCLPAI